MLLCHFTEKCQGWEKKLKRGEKKKMTGEKRRALGAELPVLVDLLIN